MYALTTPLTTMELQDNIASVDATTEYMDLFNNIDETCKEMRKIVDSVAFQPNQDSRLSIVIRYIVTMQSQMEQMYNLMVEMNNQFVER